MHRKRSCSPTQVDEQLLERAELCPARSPRYYPLDAEQGRTGGRTPNAFRLVVRPTKTVNLAVLNAWLQGRAAFGESVLEALSMCPLPSFTSCDHD